MARLHRTGAIGDPRPRESIIFLLPTVVAELSLALWLVARGVDIATFREVGTAAHAGGLVPEESVQ